MFSCGADYARSKRVRVLVLLACQVPRVCPQPPTPSARLLFVSQSYFGNLGHWGPIGLLSRTFFNQEICRVHLLNGASCVYSDDAIAYDVMYLPCVENRLFTVGVRGCPISEFGTTNTRPEPIPPIPECLSEHTATLSMQGRGNCRINMWMTAIFRASGISQKVLCNIWSALLVSYSTRSF